MQIRHICVIRVLTIDAASLIAANMLYKTLPVESTLFSRNILQLDAGTTAEVYSKEETKLVSKDCPFYIQIQLAAADLAGIQAYEELGFRFVEFRIARHLHLTGETINTRYFFPFGCELMGDSEENREQILDIASQHSSDDRFTLDPLIPKELASKRLNLYISNSLASHPRQFVYGLKNTQSGELIGFRTGEIAEPSLARYFYYFMKKGYNDPKYTAMLETFVQDALHKRRISRIEAVSSGLNVQEMNDASLLQGFVVDRTMVLLRKIFK